MQRSNYRKLLPAVIFVPFSKKKYIYILKPKIIFYFNDLITVLKNNFFKEKKRM